MTFCSDQFVHLSLYIYIYGPSFVYGIKTLLHPHTNHQHPQLHLQSQKHTHNISEHLLTLNPPILHDRT